MNRDELIKLVDKIKRCEGTEKEIDNMIEILEQNVCCPEIRDMIFFDEKTTEQIVDIALTYKPIQS